MKIGDDGDDNHGDEDVWKRQRICMRNSVQMAEEGGWEGTLCLFFVALVLVVRFVKCGKMNVTKELQKRFINAYTR